jgi:hypothetical protein
MDNLQKGGIFLPTTDSKNRHSLPYLKKMKKKKKDWESGSSGRVPV